MNPQPDMSANLRLIAEGNANTNLIRDAADRIEALEAALREVESLALVSSNTYSGLAQAGRMAREALGEATNDGS